MEIWQIIGFLAAITGTLSFIPEIIKALKSHHLNDIAWGMLYFYLSASSLWGIYGLLLNDFPLVLSATVSVSMELILIGLKYTYEKKASPIVKVQPLRQASSINLESATLKH